MSKSSRQECIICAENFTPKNAASCVYCEYTTCRTCARQYVLNESTPKCMNCKKPWTREHQNDILKPIFVNGELKKHLEQVMFDQERAQLVATMLTVENRRISQRLSSEKTILMQEMTAIHSHISLLIARIRDNNIYMNLAVNAPKMHPDVNAKELESANKLLEEEKRRKEEEIRAKRRRYNFIERMFQMPPEQRRIVYENQIDGADPNEILHTVVTENANNPTPTHKRHFVRACPIEDCRGFLSSQWKCGLCGVYTCSKCHVPKNKQCGEPTQSDEATRSEATRSEDTHVCNPDDVATAELLSKDTKPCPKCGTGIFKIDGCDQMWCTECHSAFSWRTGELSTGHVHNPHFFEYQRRMGTNTRNILDLPCNAMQPEQYHGILTTLLRTAFLHAKQKCGCLDVSNQENIAMARNRTADISMSISAFTHHLPEYRNDAIQNHLELRVQYLTEEINEAQFRSSLFRDAKKFNKNREIGQVLQTVVFAMTDILTRLVDYLRTFNRTRDELAKIGQDTTNLSAQALWNTGQLGQELSAHPADAVLEILSETDKLMEYANECLAKICAVYKVTRVGIFVRQSVANYNSNGLYTYPAGLFTVLVTKDAEGKERILPKRA